MSMALVSYENKALKFNIRDKGGYDKTVSDWIVLREMFVENVYNLQRDDLKDTGVVLDIGANIGAFSIQAAILGAKKVVAVEPEQKNFIMLCENVKCNDLEDIITCVNCGAGPKTGESILIGNQAAGFVEGAKGNIKPDNLPKQSVQLRTLEELYKLADSEFIDVLKLDCEGSEYGLFESISDEILQRFRLIKMEYHTTATEKFGSMVARLSRFYNLNLYGDYLNNGGQLYGARY